MKRIVFTAETASFNKLEPLQNELKNVGVGNFNIDFVNKQISMSCPNALNVNIVECAIRRAGFKCACFTVYSD